MRVVLLVLLMFWTSTLFAKPIEAPEIITPLQINKMFSQEKISLDGLPDNIDREEKVAICMQEYIKKQTKSYTKMAQENLYGLIHNFDSIVSKLYGQKVLQDDTPYSDKIESLAKVQCETYYKIGILK